MWCGPEFISDTIKVFKVTVKKSVVPMKSARSIAQERFGRIF